LKFREKLLKQMVFLNWEVTDLNLQELRYALGLVPTCGSPELCDFLKASSFCRHSLLTVVPELRLAQHLQAAVAFMEQGHVHKGPNVVTDPTFLHFVIWADSSKIKRRVLEYNEVREGFDLEAYQ
ncbi:hypothetical protein EI555_017760, partial [Monodon monoceros]